jgi:beta-lactamase class A
MIERMKSTSVLIFALLCVASAAGKPATDKQERLVKEISRLEAKYGGHLGFMAKNLGTGETVGYHVSERFPTASAIKLPVMAAFFDLVDQKQIDPDAIITLTKEDRKPGSGILQFLSDGDRFSLLDAVKLMITLSDNTATNLVLDRLGPTHPQRLSVVNDFLVRKGLKDTRLLNRLFSVETKQRTPEALRYGIGVSTAEDMVRLMEALYSKTLVSPSSCDAMLGILKNQSYRDMIPRFLPEEECKYLEVANKTGTVNETKVDVALVLSDKANIAIAIFVDKNPDHRGDMENRGLLLGAMVSRAVWNHFTGSTGYEERKIPANNVDWNTFPGGQWGIYRSITAPFPHGKRERGFKASGGTFYPYHPHYDDNSVVVVVPETFKETAEGTNVIIHFHGHMDDNLGVLERDGMPQALAAQRINAILVLPQGPYRADDSFGGKMEDKGGLKRLIEDMLSTMKNENIVKSTRLNKLVISADGLGYRAAAFALERGGLQSHITDVFLFDALFGRQDALRDWLKKGDGILYAAYTTAAANEHEGFEKTVSGEAGKKLHFAPTSVDHGRVVQTFFESWLKELSNTWK